MSLVAFVRKATVQMARASASDKFVGIKLTKGGKQCERIGTRASDSA